MAHFLFIAGSATRTKYTDTQVRVAATNNTPFHAEAIACGGRRRPVRLCWTDRTFCTNFRPSMFLTQLGTTACAKNPSRRLRAPCDRSARSHHVIPAVHVRFVPQIRTRARGRLDRLSRRFDPSVSSTAPAWRTSRQTIRSTGPSPMLPSRLPSIWQPGLPTCVLSHYPDPQSESSSVEGELRLPAANRSMWIAVSDHIRSRGDAENRILESSLASFKIRGRPACTCIDMDHAGSQGERSRSDRIPGQCFWLRDGCRPGMFCCLKLLTEVTSDTWHGPRTW